MSVRLRRAATAGWIGVLLVALLLRLYGLDIQSLWSDEGNSIALAQRPLARIAQETARDIHPPLYFWTLHVWVRLAGSSTVAVRALSALYGVLVVALTFVLGRRWFGRPAALVAAVAAATSPFAIHYSQEARMYMLVTLLGALTWLAFERWLARPGPGRLLLYGLAAVATLYTHYFGAVLIVAINLIWLGTCVARGRRRMHTMARPRLLMRRWIVGWIGMQALLLAAYLPWIWIGRVAIAGWPAGDAANGPIFVLRDTLRIFTVGPHVTSGWWAWAAGYMLLLAAGLLGRPLRRLPVDGRLLAAAWLCVPVGVMALLALDRPFYRPRFLLLALPAFHLLLGHGAAVLGARLHIPRLAAVAAACLVALAARGSLVAEWSDPAVWRDDYRGIARAVAATAGPEDAVLLLGPGQIEIFDYYYHGQLPRYPLPRRRPLDPAATTRELETIADRHRQLYAVLWGERESDPDGIIQEWLDAHAFKTSDRWYGNVRLAIYQFGDLQDALAPVGADFEEDIRLLRAAVEPATVYSGDVVRVAVEWQTAAPVTRPLQVFAQLLDDAGHILGQYDGTPAALPATAWPVDEPQRGRLGLQVRPGTPPGDYRLILGLYDAETFTRLTLPDGADALALAEIRVERPPVPPALDSLDMAVRRAEKIGDARLLGWRFNKSGFDHAPERPLRPGEPLSMILFWQARTAAPALPPLALRLLGPDGEPRAEWPWRPVEGRYPADRWQAGEIVRDPQTYLLPGDLPPGRYRLQLSDGSRLVELGEVQVESATSRYQPPYSGAS